MTDATAAAEATSIRVGSRRGHLLAVTLALVGLAASIVLGARSDGFYQDDDVGHFLFACRAWDNTEAMWHVWARPGYNLPATLPARLFGIFGCRVFSAVQTAATAYLAYRIARRLAGSGAELSRLAPLAAALVWVQPLVMTLSQTTLTETTAALYLTASVWLYLRCNRLAGCAVMSLLFVTRYETIVLGLLPAAVVAADALRAAEGRTGKTLRTPRMWACAAALVWAPVAYVLIAAALDLPDRASPLAMFSRSYTAAYGSGAWSHFLYRWFAVAGSGVLALAAAGAVRLGRRAWLPTALALGLVLLHTLIYRAGLFASGGYARFLVPVGGLTGALAAAGLAAAWRPSGRLAVTVALAVLALAVAGGLPNLGWFARPTAGLLGVAAAGTLLLKSSGVRASLGRLAAAGALGAIAWQTALSIRPLALGASPMHASAARCAKQVEQAGYGGNPALSSHVVFWFFRRNTHVIFDLDDARKLWRTARPGTLYLWDSKYACEPAPAGPEGSFSGLLAQFGRKVCDAEIDGARTAAFVRLPDEQLPRQTGTFADGPAD